MNPLVALQDYGQSVWLDYLRRNVIISGELEALIAEDGLRGVTSNPSIFEKAIGGSIDYDGAIKALEREKDLDAGALYERLAVEDIRMAADVLRPVFDATDGRDGFVSRELVKFGGRAYGDLVHWRDRQTADKVMQEAATSEVCSAYFAVMEPEADPAAGISLMESLEVYR